MVKATVNPSFNPAKEIFKDCWWAYGPSVLNFSMIPEKAISNLPYKIKRMCHLNLDPSEKRAQFFHLPRTQHSLGKTDLFPSIKEPVTQVFLCPCFKECENTPLIFLPVKNCLLEAWRSALHLPIFSVNCPFKTLFFASGWVLNTSFGIVL
jgi:hypothetical protein